MGYMGFGMRPELYKRKPKKFMSRRTGLFNRQLKDELIEHYHQDQPSGSAHEDSALIKEKRKKIFNKGGPDTYLEITAIGLIISIVLFFVLVLAGLS